MNRQLYQIGGPIEEAENFYTNNLGMAPQEARTVLSNALNSYSQNIQPQSMMQMASNGGRIGFSEGGLSEYELLKLKELGYNVRKEGPETFGGISVLKDILKTNKLAGGGIARLGYQMGGVSTMPMDYGQSLQVPQQMPTNFSSAQNITMNPLLNYGQTPLTMNMGGIARLGYQTGGVTVPSQGSELSQLGQMDPAQAVEVITKLLIENGIPPEQAQQLALQIIQIFAQGGAPAVEEFANQLEQQEQAEAMASGGIAGYGYRQGYGFGGIGRAIGSVFKGAAKAVSGVVKGVANAVKSVVKSDIGKLALLAGGAYLMMNPGMFAGFGAGATAAGTAGTLATEAGLAQAGLGGLGTSLTAGTGSLVLPTATSMGLALPATAGGLTTAAGSLALPAATSITAEALAAGTPSFFETAKSVAMDPSFSGIKSLGQQGLSSISNLGSEALDYAKKNKLTTALTAVNLLSLGSKLGVPRNEGEDDMSYEKRLQEAQGYVTNYGRNLKITNPYFYQREGAVNPFAPTMAAQGGIMGYRKGGSMVPPARQIEGGVIELDARKTGGYIPYGKKERVDDVPAMLAKDEFVFTSRAVKAAGGGSAKRGAARMYALMKQLEGARA